MADPLEALREFAFDDGAGGPLVITVERPLSAHGQRLADSLGVRVEVKPVTSTVGRGMGSYIVPAPSFATPDGPRADWIDYRASIASVHRREQNGDQALTCDGCGTETDVTDIVHSPHCPVVTGVKPKKAADWDQKSVIAALQAYAREHDGQGPSSVDWMQASTGRPNYATVVRLFGSWNEGILAAGLEARRGGRRRSRRTADADARDEAAAVLRELHARRELQLEGSAGQGAHPRTDSPSDAAATPEATLPSPESTRKTSRGGRRLGSGRPPLWDEARAIELIQSLAKDGVAPSATETQKAGLSAYPIKRLGGFAHLVERAGLQRRGHGAASPAASDERQQPPIVWAVKVPDTGLRYRTVDEALVAAAEIEHDGEEVAQRARIEGQDGKADQAIDASRELAQKIREACDQISRGEAVPASVEPEAAVPARERPVTSQETTDPVGNPLNVADLSAGELVACGQIMQTVGTAVYDLNAASRARVARFIAALLEAAGS